MVSALLVSLALLGQAAESPATSASSPPPPPSAAKDREPAAAEAPPSALIAHLGMEIDDLDYEVARQRAALGIARTKLAITQRALQRGVASRGEVEQVMADVRALETREAEALAFQALKAYERDVLAGKVTVDESKAHALVLELLRKQQAIAQVEVDFNGYKLKQDDALLARGAIAQPERDEAMLDYDTARLQVALSLARQAQLALDFATRPGPHAAAAEEQSRLRKAYLQARVHYYELAVGIARTRFEMARSQLRTGHMTQSDVDYYQQALDTATANLSAEQKLLADPNAAPPTNLPRAGS